MFRRSLTISKNARSKEHAICMQAFLRAAKLLATINEKANERNTFKASKSAHYKVFKPVVEKCLAIPTEVAKSITSHTRHVRFASQRYKQLIHGGMAASGVALLVTACRAALVWLKPSEAL